MDATQSANDNPSNTEAPSSEVGGSPADLDEASATESRGDDDVINDESDAPADGAPADNELVDRTRAGDRAAFGELWIRHAQSGRMVAKSMTTFDADDVVAESFARIYAAIMGGGGPKTGFRSYLYATVRNTAATWGRAKHEVAIENVDVLDEVESSEDEALRNLDRGLSAQAFRSLPDRWQEALWYSEVENMSHKETAKILGINPGAVAVLTYRAREGMRRAWINAHISSAGSSAECRWTIEHLAAYTRNSATERETRRIESHLAACDRCPHIATEAKGLGQWLPLIILVPVIGATAAAGYLSTFHGTPVASYAMGSGAMPTSATAGGAEASGTGLGSSVISAGRTGSRRALRNLARRRARTAAGIAAGAATVAGLVVAALVVIPQLVPSPTPTSPGAAAAATTESRPFSASLSTGSGDVFLPSARGTGEPGARITVSQGAEELYSTTVDPDGRWSTPQLDAAESGTIDVAESESDDGETESVSLDYALSVPGVELSVEGGRTSIVVTGLPNAPIQVTFSRDSKGASSSLVARTLDASGRWSWTFTLPDSPGAIVAVRYAAGDRFGVPAEA